ncbi:MAG: hypothetical protein AABX91_00455 [Nanoarchaeota archaeon]
MDINLNKPKIAVDIDGVLADYQISFVEFYNKRNGKNFSIQNLIGHDFWLSFGISKEKAEKEIIDFFSSEKFKKLSPVTDSQDAIKLLAQKNILSIVTARPDFVRETTLEWLDAHFPNIFSEIHFTSQFGGNGPREKKSDFCLDYNYEIIIEDIVEHANECAEKGIKVFLLNRPWNKNFSLHPLVQRVNDWNEISQILQQK